MNRYDPETVEVLAERGSPGPRLLRGVLWALFLAFLASIFAFSVAVIDPRAGQTTPKDDIAHGIDDQRTGYFHEGDPIACPHPCDVQFDAGRLWLNAFETQAGQIQLIYEDINDPDWVAFSDVFVESLGE